MHVLASAHNVWFGAFGVRLKRWSGLGLGGLDVSASPRDKILFTVVCY
jgi:hypothetical protein